MIKNKIVRIFSFILLIIFIFNANTINVHAENYGDKYKKEAEHQFTEQYKNNVPRWEDGCKSYNFTYMDYKAVTSDVSPQYEILNHEDAYSDPETGMRMYDGRYFIAIGTGYGAKPGDYVNIMLKDDSIIECIVGDMKSDRHTDPSNKYQSFDGSVVECIVDSEYFESSKQYKTIFTCSVIKVVPLNDF